MYYVNLGQKVVYSPDGFFQDSTFINGLIDGQKDVGLVHNLQSSPPYWSGTEYLPGAYPPSSSHAWSFNPHGGSQSVNGQEWELYAWAVRDGDVAFVPEPEVYTLLIAGLGLLVVARRRRRSFGGS